MEPSMRRSSKENLTGTATSGLYGLRTNHIWTWHLPGKALLRIPVERAPAPPAAGWTSCRKLLAGSRCLADVFGDAYEILPREAETEPRPGSLVSRSCGGCPACRRKMLRPRTGVMPTPRPAWLNRRTELPADLTRLLGTVQEAMLFDDLLGRAGGSDRQRRERLLRYLVAKGMRSVVAPAEVLDWLRPLFSAPASPPVFFDEEWQPLLLPRVPALIIRPPATTLLATHLAFGRPRAGGSDAPRILWLPADTRDPEKPHCLLAQRSQWVTYPIEEFCTRVGL